MNTAKPHCKCWNKYPQGRAGVQREGDSVWPQLQPKQGPLLRQAASQGALSQYRKECLVNTMWIIPGLGKRQSSQILKEKYAVFPGTEQNTQTALQPHSNKMARCNRALQTQQCYKQISNGSADKEGIKHSILGIHPMSFSQKSVLCGIKQSQAFKEKEVCKWVSEETVFHQGLTRWWKTKSCR